MESYSLQGIKELFGGKYQIYPGTVKENIPPIILSFATIPSLGN